MHKALHPGDEVDRIYMSCEGNIRGLSSIQISVDAMIERQED